MNNSKKTLKYREPKKQEKKSINPKIWLITGIALVVLLIVSILFDQLYKRKIFTIDGDDYYLEDLTYYINVVETNYAYLDQYYGQLFGTSYWNMAADASSGTTMRDAARDEAIDTALYYEILYREALTDGYEITEDEEQTIADQVDLLINEQYSDKMKEHNGFTKEYLTEVFTKMAIVDRYRSDIVNSLDIDDEAIKATFDYEDYREYEIETLFIPATKTDDGKQITLTDDEKSKLQEKLSNYYDDALNSEDWSELLPEDEEDVQYNNLKYYENSSIFSKETKDIILAMENGDVSEIIEESDGYYIIKMVNNKSTESFDAAVNQAIREEENKRFSEEYDIIKSNYDYKVYKSGVKTLYMGQVTLVD